MREGGEAAPCLYSNNSTETLNSSSSDEKLEYVKSLTNLLSPYHKRQAHTLFSNVERLITKEAKSPDHVAFLTLTFQENVTDHAEAYKRFRSFNSHYLAPHKLLLEWVCSKERQKRGAWHYHLVIACENDIKTGFDFDLYEEWLDGPRKPGTFPTGNAAIKELWHDISQNLTQYGLGRIFSVEPIRKNAEAMARYVGKYISKHIGSRSEQDKGVRLVNYSRGWTKNSMRFAWHTENAQKWRDKLKWFAVANGCTEMYQLSEKLGPGWAYKYMDEIINVYRNPHLLYRMQGKEYENPVIKTAKQNRLRREKYMEKNLTLHSKICRESREKEQFKQDVIPKVKEYVSQMYDKCGSDGVHTCHECGTNSTFDNIIKDLVQMREKKEWIDSVPSPEDPRYVDKETGECLQYMPGKIQNKVPF